MALSPDSVKVKNSNERSKSKKNKKNQGNDKDEEDMGCWFKLRLLGSCMPSRSKVDSSLSGISTHDAQSKSTNDKNKDQPAVPAMSSTTTTSNAESASSFPTFSEELKLASQLRKFTFNDLKLATRNFRPESLLGEGGFGCVFKGWIEENGTAPVKPGTGLTVAVKTLNHDGLQGHKEWLESAVGNLSASINIMKKDLEIISCRNSSLNQHNLFLHMLALFKISSTIDAYFSLVTTMLCAEGSLPLPWSIRMKIALGAAQGLAFLHEEADRPVIYRDFKTSNILLDADYNSKLSDFGLAKDAPDGGKTHVSTRVMGTYGYAAPEYVMTGPDHLYLVTVMPETFMQNLFFCAMDAISELILMTDNFLNRGCAAFDNLVWCQSNIFHTGLGHLTSKSDVYSFGVVLLEMLTGRRSMDKNRPNGEHNLVEWARPHFGDKRRFYRLLDPRLEGHFSIKGAQKAIQLAAQCLSRDPKSRPRMSEVVEALKPLPNLKDMASSSYYFQTMQADRNKSNMNAKNGIRTHAGFVTRNGQPLRSLSDVRASPYNQPQQSPKPRGKSS
ncbi:hypothetical protein OIU85_007537 [Salix viminalis]|uniref:Protein kinase domain-containing protein n=1 Tax=Salix viminalis TaxID=40686 RepID=A0A9Q0SNT6_SALVM|nr:hypothetical protein OIU85_007537 [Salix viminalis]